MSVWKPSTKSDHYLVQLLYLLFQSDKLKRLKEIRFQIFFLELGEI